MAVSTTPGSVCAIFGDLVKSSALPNRGEVQDTLIKVAAELNKSFGDSLLAPAKVVSGDSLHLALCSPADSYRAICLVQDRMYPCQVRFAVGIGPVTTGLRPDVDLLDGPAFHRAAEAMAILKNRKRAQGRQVLYVSADPDWDEHINTVVFLVTAIKSGWTPTQRARVALVEANRGRIDAACSAHSVRRTLRLAHYRAVADAEDLIQAILRGSEAGLG